MPTLGDLLLGRQSGGLLDLMKQYGAGVKQRVGLLADDPAEFTRQALLDVVPNRAEAQAAQARVMGGSLDPQAYSGYLGKMQDLGGLLGSMIGPSAKTWNAVAATRAQKMADQGIDARTIWQETGTYKGVDGKWRQEIDDSRALFNTSVVNGKKQQGDLTHGYGDIDLGPTVGGLLEHDELAAAYGRNLAPHTYIGNKNTMFGDGVQGSFDNGRLTINAPAKANDAKSVALHELQHAIQQREGWAQGGSPARMESIMPDQQAVNDAQVLRAIVRRGTSPEDAPSVFLNMLGRDSHPIARILMHESDDSLHAMNPREAYRRLAGEAEARAVEARMSMTPEQRRTTFPLDSYDVPLDQLILTDLLGD